MIHLDYQGAELSPKFKKTLVALLLPSTSYDGNDVIYNYDDANEICKEFRLKWKHYSTFLPMAYTHSLLYQYF